MDKTEIKEDLEENTNDKTGVENTPAEEINVENETAAAAESEALAKLTEELEGASRMATRGSVLFHGSPDASVDQARPGSAGRARSRARRRGSLHPARSDCKRSRERVVIATISG